VSIGFVSVNLIYNRVVFGSKVLTRLLIGSGSCYTCLCNRVSRVDPNPTRLPKLPTLTHTHTFILFFSSSFLFPYMPFSFLAFSFFLFS
jgi:hypothetical protein